MEEKDLKSDAQTRAVTDKELFVNFATGDKNAFARIMKLYQSRALNFAYRYLGNREEAEDAAQDCFVKIYFNRRRFDVSKEFEPWFYQILANVCRDRIRKKSRLSNFLVRFKQEEKTDEMPSPDNMKPDSELFAKALQKLSASKREVIALRFNEDLSYGEIADALGISEGTVMSRLHRAKKDLERILRTMGIRL